ncbi:MAG: 2-oxoacid:acceptor oxidoreductase family protein [Clostridiales bacterium]|nr:2-oxoacid:acceptor oxidoreductase family protein [Eubacteriales bacterium]MCI7095163.1 2-oxoacid:acceptor oxidoreductase family protein [Clostridiales bacterium]MDD6054820.1 2-oxoacid:acceptor oxidoreductase family protein [Clostridiales bacterium]MDD7506724.1 2-oxoacid:acceptor oxidoreductase family protein [Clostridiales bacterium]MDY5678081.1 2-oxoacid:acceptor oxidoreductase family protein [Eubacteriales bacterium]
MESRIVMSGFGGQGVLTIGKYIVYGGMHDDKEVSWMPSYGPEMRGGTASCSVVVSDRQVGSPIVTMADVVIVMNKPSLTKFLPCVKKGGYIFVNSSLIDAKVDRDDINVVYVPANEIAEANKNGRSANIVMFGAYVKHAGVTSYDTAVSVLKHMFEKKPAVLESVMKCFEAGYAL